MDLRFKGINYRSPLAYNSLTFLKLLSDYDLRFKIARQYIHEGDSLLDVCAGDGRLQQFLPKGCSYFGIDASQEFTRRLSQKGLGYSRQDLHGGLSSGRSVHAVVVMIISLCHFRYTSADALLESFKSTGRKVVIVEDVLENRDMNRSLKRRLMNYLCRVDYCESLELYTHHEFAQILEKHDYKVTQYDQRYSVGTFGI